MRILLLILLLAFGVFSASAAEKVTLSITVSNLPATGDALGFSAPATKLITWTNTTSTIWVSTNLTRAGSATNLFLQMAAYAPWTPRPTLQWSSPTSFLVSAECGAIITVTNSGTWAVLALDTNDCAPLRDVRVPIASERFSTSRVEIASLLVLGISDYSTNLFKSNSVALGHVVQLNTNAQRVLGPKKFDQLDTSTNITTIYGGTNNGTRILNSPYIGGVLGSITNGYGTNTALDVPILTNATVYGGLASPGLMADLTLAANSLQVGSSAFATNSSATAIGAAALAGGDGATALGNAATATNSQAIAIGPSALAGGYTSIAIGSENAATATNAIAIGTGASATFHQSIAIGVNAAATEANQMVLGAASQVALVTIPGRIQSGSLTNNTLTGTNVNLGDWSDAETTSTSLANGNNVAVSSTGVYVRWAASGPTASFAICGLIAGRDGQVIDRWNDTGQVMTIANQSGVDPAAANRIITTTGADVVCGTNEYVSFRYSAARARWVLRNKSQ